MRFEGTYELTSFGSGLEGGAGAPALPASQEGGIDTLRAMFDRDPELEERVFEVATDPKVRAVVDFMHHDPELGGEIITFINERYAAELKNVLSPDSSEPSLHASMLSVSVAQTGDEALPGQAAAEEVATPVFGLTASEVEIIKVAVAKVGMQLHAYAKKASTESLRSYDEIRSCLRFAMGALQGDPAITQALHAAAPRPFYVKADGSIMRPHEIAKFAETQGKVDKFIVDSVSAISSATSTVVTRIKENKPVPMTEDGTMSLPLAERSWGRQDGEEADTFAYPALLATERAVRLAKDRSAKGIAQVSEAIQNHHLTEKERKVIAFGAASLVATLLVAASPTSQERGQANPTQIAVRVDSTHASKAEVARTTQQKATLPREITSIGIESYLPSGAEGRG